MIPRCPSFALSTALAWSTLLVVGVPAAAQSPKTAEEFHVPAGFATIQEAIDAAPSSAHVVVADGVWTGAGNRDLVFGGKDIVVRSANGAANCVIDAQGTPAEPYRAFDFFSGETRASVIQGFTIQGGATLDGAIADQFNGGAIRIVNSGPTILDCVFQNNYAGCWGAAVYGGHNATMRIERCMFVNNYANDDGGGFFSWDQGQIEIVRSAFIGNEARVTGGAIASFGGTDLTLENLTIVDNVAPWGGAVYSFSETNLSNSIVWGNVSQHTDQLDGNSLLIVENSIVEDGFPGIGNLDVDPRLAGDRVHLLPWSPALNMSWNSRIGSSLVDFEGDGLAGRPDVGADEFQFSNDGVGSAKPPRSLVR